MTIPPPPTGASPAASSAASPSASPDASWRGRAPAKVNLFLRVLAREEGGYHQIETLFQALELADEVEIRPLATPDVVELEVAGVPPGALGPVESNLAVRAARLLLEAAAVSPRPGFRIRLTKRIPHGAGLGGGSSDAAAVLRGVNHLLGHPLDRSALVSLGGQLGADVAFFLCGSPLALAWGRGDRLLPLNPLPPAPVILALPEARIATPDAYQALAGWRRLQLDSPPGAHLFSPPTSWTDVVREAENAFAPALRESYPELDRIRLALLEAGASTALLSGSGSAVFGLFAPGGGPEPDRGGPSAAQAGLAAVASLVVATRTASHPDGEDPRA